MKFWKFIICINSLLLLGCATTSEKFDCAYGKGVGCHSISEVNQKINDGNLLTIEKNNAKPDLEAIGLKNFNVQRVVAEHLKIWIAPFQDEQGNFHESSIIHATLRPGFWQVDEC